MALPSPALSQICTSHGYLNNKDLYRIINLKPKNCSDFFHPRLNITCETEWFSASPNVTAIAPNSITTDVHLWEYKPMDELSINIPLTKPLTVECPIPACVFPISGWYSDLQRYLVYTNVFVAAIATRMPVLRGIAQLYLFSTGIVSSIHYLIMLNISTVNNFVDMDFFPALLYSLSAEVAMVMWSFLRGWRRWTSRRSATFLQHICFLWGPVPLLFFLGILVLLSEFYWSDMSKVPAVLLESQNEFRLTSACYVDDKGRLQPWTGLFDYPIRQSGELMIIPLPTGATWSLSKALAKKALFPLRDRALDGFWISYALSHIIVGIFMICFRTGCVSRTPLWIATFIICIPFLVLLVTVEVAIHASDLPRSEVPHQFSQWAPWAVAALVAAGAIFAHLADTDRWKRQDQGGETEMQQRERDTGTWCTVCGPPGARVQS